MKAKTRVPILIVVLLAGTVLAACSPAEGPIRVEYEPLASCKEFLTIPYAYAYPVTRKAKGHYMVYRISSITVPEGHKPFAYRPERHVPFLGTYDGHAATELKQYWTAELQNIPPGLTVTDVGIVILDVKASSADEHVVLGYESWLGGDTWLPIPSPDPAKVQYLDPCLPDSFSD